MTGALRTIKSATYVPSAERTDDLDRLLGDTVEVRFEECDHVRHGNPTMHYKVGSKITCRDCNAGAQS